jgi:hypothetical protein
MRSAADRVSEGDGDSMTEKEESVMSEIISGALK